MLRNSAKTRNGELVGKQKERDRGIIMVGRTESGLVTRIMSKVSLGRPTSTLCTAFTSDLAVGRVNGSYASESFRGTSRKCSPG